MKKLIGIIAVLLLFASCGGNSQNSEKLDVLFVEVSDEDQKLFQDEIGTNAELYLGNLAENYKISEAIPVTVFDRKESELSGSMTDLDLDGSMFTIAVTQALLGNGLTVPEDLDNRIKQTEYQDVLNDGGVGYALNIGEDRYISYIYFPGDQRSYSFLPTGLSESLQFIEDNKNEAYLAGKSETDQLVTVSMQRIVYSLDAQVFTSFNCQLSNGTTLRVGFLAEKK